jgi:hypothetical protein
LTEANRREHIQAVIDAWKERCLLDDGSLIYDDERLWDLNQLSRAYHNIAEQPRAHSLGY